MAQAVVSAERLSPALAAWRAWDLALPLQAPPRLGLQTAQGSGHAIFEIRSDEEARTPLLARIRTQSTRSVKGGFHQEMAAWQAAANAGLAPKLVYVDELNEVVICHKSSSTASIGRRRDIRPTLQADIRFAISGPKTPAASGHQNLSRRHVRAGSKSVATRHARL